MFEVEVRSFISKEKYLELLDFFSKEGNLVKEDNQTTYYFDCDQDLRIQKNNFYSKIWMKKGKLHDDTREEIEIKFEREQFDQLENLFLSLGHKVEIKWFRKRHVFEWEDIKVCVDHTQDYGYIIELEKKTEDDQEETLNMLKQKLDKLSIQETPKEEFKQRYETYKNEFTTIKR